MVFHPQANVEQELLKIRTIIEGIRTTATKELQDHTKDPTEPATSSMPLVEAARHQNQRRIKSQRSSDRNDPDEDGNPQRLEQRRKPKGKWRHQKPRLRKQGPLCVPHQEPELSSRAENTELREQMEERKSAGLVDENNPKNGQVLVEQVVAKGGENQAKLSSEKSRETEECL
nr:myomegalin-like [Equus asinus]